MIYTLICIICTTLLGILFKWSEKYKARAAAIIPINYFICFTIGFTRSGTTFLKEFSTAWIPYSIGLGFLFILGFSCFAKTIQIAGLPIATLFQKMSIILTVIVAVLLGDHINRYQFIGLLIGIISFFFILGIRKTKMNNTKNYFVYLIGTLVISSCIEITFIFVDKIYHFSSELKLIFPSYLFLVAGLLGMLSLHIISGTFTITKMEILFGVLLGIPNFYSIYYMMMSLDHEMSGSIFFPALNCSVIALSSLLAWYLFKEKLNHKQLGGIVLSMISIFLIFYFKK